MGYGAAKGFGQVQLTDWQLSFAYLGDEDAPPLKPFPAETSASGVYTVVNGSHEQPEAWLTLAQTWVNDFRDKLLGTESQSPFKRESENLTPIHDNYFRQTASGRWLHHLYPSEVNLL